MLRLSLCDSHTDTSFLISKLPFSEDQQRPCKFLKLRTVQTSKFKQKMSIVQFQNKKKIQKRFRWKQKKKSFCKYLT